MLSVLANVASSKYRYRNELILFIVGRCEAHSEALYLHAVCSQWDKANTCTTDDCLVQSQYLFFYFYTCLIHRI